MADTLSIDIGTKHLAWARFGEDQKPNAGGVEDIDRATIRESIEAALGLLADRARLPKQVLIEQQPLRHAKMMAIMHGLFGAFRALGCDVAIVSPKVRAAELLLPPDASYPQRKRAAVAACDRLLGEAWREWLRGAHKADDLAEALLQGLVWLRRNAPKRVLVLRREEAP